jgi:hypothetical protein
MHDKNETPVKVGDRVRCDFCGEWEATIVAVADGVGQHFVTVKPGGRGRSSINLEIFEIEKIEEKH